MMCIKSGIKARFSTFLKMHIYDGLHKSAIYLCVIVLIFSYAICEFSC